MTIFRVWVSRRWWFWPKRYICKGMIWGGTPAATDVPPGVIMLILKDERRVFIDSRGRTITYGREFFDWQVAEAEKDAGQALGIAS